MRAESASESLKTHLGELFWDWGIPTALSIIVVRETLTKLPVIASGGIRNGLEIAKCIAIGSDMGAMAYPFLVNAVHSKEALYRFADTVIAEASKSTMFLVGGSRYERSQECQAYLNWRIAIRGERILNISEIDEEMESTRIGYE